MGAFKLLPWRTIFVSLSSSTCLKRMLFFFLAVNTLYRTVEVRSLALTRSLPFRSQCSHEKVCNLAIRLYPGHRIKKIICDGGAEFVNEEMNAWCRKLGIKFLPEPSHRAHLKLCEKTSDSGLHDDDNDGDRITAEIFLGKWARNSFETRPIVDQSAIHHTISYVTKSQTYMNSGSLDPLHTCIKRESRLERNWMKIVELASSYGTWTAKQDKTSASLLNM